MAGTDQLVVRPVAAGDAGRLADLLARVPSPPSVRARDRARVTLAAVDPRDGSFAGVAQYAPGGDGESDVAFAIDAEWQRRGAGATLALELLRRAARRRRPRLRALLHAA